MGFVAGELSKYDDLQWKLTSTRLEEWSKNDLFHLKWWLLLAIFLLSVFVWWKIIDKARLNELVLYTGIITIIILILDELGEELTLWDYPIDILPLFPPISAIDLACLPLVYSLMYQFFKTWKSYTIASIIFSIVSCFILEPLFVFSGIYQMLTWKSFYGLPLYFAIAIFGKAILVKISAVESRHTRPL